MSAASATNWHCQNNKLQSSISPIGQIRLINLINYFERNFLLAGWKFCITFAARNRFGDVSCGSDYSDFSKGESD